jgi:hypothetical protein
MTLRTIVLFFGAAGFLAACGDDDPPTGVCTPGASAACVGAGGCAGGQVCNADGSGFGACDCGGAVDAGRDGGPGPVDSGPADSGPADTGPADTGGPDVPSGPCDLVAQTGCAAGERCAWVPDDMDRGAHVCVPDGTVALHAPCTTFSPGVPDDCRAGTSCLGGVCATICNVTAGCGSTDFACARYAGFGGEDTGIGICDPTCDPVTQTRNHDDAAACGSPEPATPSRTCIGEINGPFLCAPIAGDALTRTHGMTALGPPGGGAYQNGCAPGYMPLFLRPGTSEVMCIALCDPAEAYAGSDAMRQGTPPYTCAARGATGRTVECRFHWFLQDETGMSIPEVGVCVDYAMFTYDHDMMPGTPDRPWPSCSTLSNTDTDGDGMLDHLEWGCGPDPTP